MQNKNVIKREKIIEDFKNFLNKNCEKLKEATIYVKDLPADDDLIKDDKWDEIYK